MQLTCSWENLDMVNVNVHVSTTLAIFHFLKMYLLLPAWQRTVRLICLTTAHSFKIL